MSQREWYALQDRVTVGDEEIPARHPLGDMTLSEIAKLYNDLKEAYPQYQDFRYEYHMKSHRYGAMTYWYDLEGYHEHDWEHMPDGVRYCSCGTSERYGTN